MNDHKLVLVTGASRGIGHAIANHLASQGYKVIGTSTSSSGADAISKELSQYGGEGRVLNVNDDIEIIQEFYNEINSNLGVYPEILINNAGIKEDGLLLRMNEEQWSSVIHTNLSSVFKMSKVAMKPMIKKRWGRIISISSVVGTMGNPGQANYAAAKAGLEGFSKSLALEVATRGITVNLVSPGFIGTDMTDSMNEKQRNAILDQIPMARMGHVDEVAALVAFICSDHSAYISGHNFHINGGLLMR